ncbi:glutamate racemase [Candidatus Daviesbacteria bacterium RIFCSPLOWO2_01_FULL_38_10]|nr:MAG: glutamate racemase [Candidatus Daviesbacteria bacterium RIFCSPLOWO2_01_FULL_38_10]OGE73090.1 MAG: glutamate racemase [Candidatus Daviesbacteria bacterium RIFCSPLOWO2_12_FULL_38_10]HBQ50658.1 glutamate racemase [Candidatus Daviesbacteria bacterium]HCB22765.1 glutamate racemase [Candidatus Daviesbacteria bacterium]
MNFSPIGVFDSGIGGLTVVKEIIKLLPNESIIYLGDTARVPYGTRSKEVVTKFALELVKFLLKRKVKVLVVACNTISALAISEIEEISTVPVVGVVLPAVAEAVKVTKNKRIGVIGTQGTIESKVYEQGIKKIDTSIKVVSVGCPLFVPMAEEGLHNHKAAKLMARDYLDEVLKAKVDTLILGCTHYPLLLETIRETVGPSVTLVDSAKPTALELKKVLSDNDLFSNNQNPILEFYVTDAPERVFQVAGRFFGEKINNRLKKVNLED